MVTMAKIKLKRDIAHSIPKYILGEFYKFILLIILFFFRVNLTTENHVEILF